MLTMTCTTSPVVPGELIAIAPWKLPADRSAGFTATLTELPVVAELGFTLNQAILLFVVAEAVKVVVGPLVLMVSC